MQLSKRKNAGKFPGAPKNYIQNSKLQVTNSVIKRRARQAMSKRRMHDEDQNRDDSIVGFGIQKIFDRKSIFCGLPSLNTIASYVEVIIDNWHFIPHPKDGKILARAKIAALIWRGLRNIDFKHSQALNTANLVEIDFGPSQYIISDLLDEIVEPDEIFRPQGHTAFTPPFFLFRYPIKNGFMYWVLERDSEDVRKVYVTKGLTKDDVLEFIWSNLNSVIQLEASNEGLTYFPTELMQKKIFGSSNNLITQLQQDYEYFRANNLSRGYLLIGKPGTGKTGIVNSIVDKAGRGADGRIFIISGLDGIGTVEQMESLFVQMRPNFIIFDDCDRSGSSPSFIRAILKMLETVKDRNPHTNFLFTANTFSGILYDEAVTRKGRIDQIYEVPEPSEDDRREIFKRYSSEMNIELSDDDLEKCISSSDGMTGADIKELCIQLQRATLDEVFERARELEILREKYSGEDFNDEDVLGLTKRTKKKLAQVMAGRLIATKVR
jgi:hypothetical protein